MRLDRITTTRWLIATLNTLNKTIKQLKVPAVLASGWFKRLQNVYWSPRPFILFSVHVSTPHLCFDPDSLMDSVWSNVNCSHICVCGGYFVCCHRDKGWNSSSLLCSTQVLIRICALMHHTFDPSEFDFCLFSMWLWSHDLVDNNFRATSEMLLRHVARIN